MQADIATVEVELTYSVTSIQQAVDIKEGHLRELETSATATCDSVSAIEVMVSELPS